jgi:Flp pilus assembly protein TadG
MDTCLPAAHGERGAAAVEFALVSVVLLFILVGILQFGITFWQWLEVEHAAREGARWSALQHAGGSVSSAMPANPQDRTVRKVVRQTTTGLTPALSNAQIAISNEAPSELDVGTPVTVTITYPSPIIAPLVAPFLGGGTTFALRASATQRVE